jgi:fused signal recognition particle receptor
LVVDGTLGQNSLIQAKQFHEALGLSGVIVTKLDGTARGGSVLSIASDLKLPIRFIGVGEGVGDLVPFESASFASALLAK